MSRSPSLSVVIPTRDRREVLSATLAALDAQDDSSFDFEVLVVDDGSSDGTPELLAQAKPETYRLRWWARPPQGPAAARNFAIRQAESDRILLLGDDTLPAPHTLAAHLEASESDQGVQGHIDWDPDVPTTDVMRFLAPAGPQFYFVDLEDGEPIPFTAVLASNFSAPKHWFIEDPFDEGFPNACGEDTELAYRWRAKNRRAVYCQNAVCWHRHHYGSIAPFLKRQQRAGQAARYAVRLHPTLLWPMVLQPTLVGGRTLLRLAWRRRPQGPPLDFWDWQCRWHFLKGFVGLA